MTWRAAVTATRPERAVTARHDETVPAMRRTLTDVHDRPLPADLVRRLRRARRLEHMADNLDRQRRAITATGALLLAAVDAGWRQTELAPVTGVTRTALQKRLAAARAQHTDHAPALDVDPPPAPDPTPHQYLASAAADEREWLSKPEAAALLGVDPYTVRNWRAAGLLPNTRDGRVPHLYSRIDLEALRDAPKYKGRGVHYSAVRLGFSGD